MNQTAHATWKCYEAGQEYKRQLGLYETVRRNERFYRGDHWYASDLDLPHPIFNYVRRITDYLVETVAPGSFSIQYGDDKLPYIRDESVRASVNTGLDILNRHAEYRWKRSGMDSLLQNVLLDAAITGDGILYCWWNGNNNDGQLFSGNIQTDRLDNTNLFVADVNQHNLQQQEYIILAGRATVASLKEEARYSGLSDSEIAGISPDSNTRTVSDDNERLEVAGEEKTTYLLKFYRENGEVVFEKSTQTCLLKKVYTGLRYYPVAMLNWQKSKNSFHGNAPVSDMIANQKYINTAYAMVMKHMSDTAFSKVVYDKSRIPEWSNEVGEAIGALGGGNVADAVSIVGVGQLQNGYLDLIQNVIDNTKSMMGATEVSLGDGKATNTSAILALQQASRSSLNHVTVNVCRFIGELASIWADMLCTYCPKDRFLTVVSPDGLSSESPDYSLLKKELIHATATVCNIDRYTPSSTVSILDKLLDKDFISVEDYLQLLPPGTLSDKDSILRKINLKGALHHGGK